MVCVVRLEFGAVVIPDWVKVGFVLAVVTLTVVGVAFGVVAPAAGFVVCGFHLNFQQKLLVKIIHTAARALVVNFVVVTVVAADVIVAIG